MSILRLSLKGLIYNWRLSVCLLLGTFLASSILAGSLLVGDSVKKTLKSKAFERIGSIDSALITGDRYVTDDFVEKLSEKILHMYFWIMKPSRLGKICCQKNEVD